MGVPRRGFTRAASAAGVPLAGPSEIQPMWPTITGVTRDTVTATQFRAAAAGRDGEGGVTTRPQARLTLTMPTGNPTVDRALEAHGGEARWRQVTSLRTTWTFRGMMFKLRLREASLRGLRATLSTIRPAVAVEPFPGPGSVGRFTPEAVEVQPANGPPRRLEQPRESFRSLASIVWWNDFQMLYFAGYVLWNYAQLPFLLLQPGLTLRSAGSTTVGGEVWDKVEVAFPPGFPTHSALQTFYFGPEGRLRRHDYAVSILSPLARGARFIHRYHQVEGLTLPARIEMKLGTVGERYLSAPSLGFVDLDDLSLG